MTILHLLPRSVWEEVRADDRYVPAAYEADGFVHCTGDDDVMLAVANRYYRGGAGGRASDAGEELVVWELDEARLAAEVRWEAADPVPPPGVDPATRFPHVYGPLDLRAVVGVRRLVRGPDGTFVAYGPID